MKNKISFLFLVYDVINHEDIWFSFLKNVDPNDYSLYIHNKTQKCLKYFEEFKISQDLIVDTKWGHISLVKAQNILIKESLKDPDNQHFVIVSNSCIPVKKFSHIHENLEIDKSYFNKSPDNQVFPRANPAKAHIDEKYIKKQHAWCILNRKHAQLICDHEKEILNWFKDVEVPDENCYITFMHYMDLMNEVVVTENESYGGTTFTNWTSEGLKNYSSITKEEIDKLLTSKCFFARKFNENCDLSYLKNWHETI